MLTTMSQKMYAKAQIAKNNLVEKVQNFHRDETSAHGTSEEGTLTYGSVVVGVIVTAIFVAGLTLAYNAFMDQLAEGTSKTPSTWE